MSRPFILLALLVTACEGRRPTAAEDASRSAEHRRETLAVFDSIADPNDPEDAARRRRIVEGHKRLERLDRIVVESEALRETASAKAE